MERKQMPASNEENLSIIEDLIRKGDYSEALEFVLAILSNDNLSPESRIFLKLTEGRIRIKLGSFEDARAIIDDILNHTEKANSLMRAETLLLEIEILWRSGRIDDGLNAFKNVENIAGDIEESSQNHDKIAQLKGNMMRHAGILHWYKGDTQIAEEKHISSLEFYEEANDAEGILNAYNNLGLVYWTRGNLDDAALYFEKALEGQEQYRSKAQIATILNNLGNVYVLQGDLERGYEHHQRSLELREELGNYRDLAISLANLGSVYQTRGNINQSLECLHRSLEYFEEGIDARGLSLALNNLGSVYSTKGDLDTALEYHQRSLAIKREINDKQDIALSLLNIGEIYQRKGDLERAFDNYNESHLLYNESGNESYIAISLFSLIDLEVERSHQENAKIFLEKLSELNKKSKNRPINHRYRVAQALILKSSTRGRDKLDAQDILSKVVEEEIADHTLTTTAMIHLCDLLLFELKMTNNEELLERVSVITKKLSDIGREQGSYTLITKTNILQSKFALVEGDVEKARILLAQAHITAQEKGLNLLARKVTHERDMLQSQLDKWENMIRQNPTKREMVEMANLDDFLERMIRKTVSVITQEEKKYIDDDAIKKKYILDYIDLLEGSQKSEKSNFRIGIAQIGISTIGNILDEFYIERETGLLGIKEEKISEIVFTIQSMVERAHFHQIKILLFPEMIIDMNHKGLVDQVAELAKEFDMYIIPGSYHAIDRKQNVCTVIGPEGILWKQDKHIPAIIHIEGKRFTEGIHVGVYPRRTIVCNTEYGRIAITICRDFLDMDLRVELKNFDPPIDLIFNPAFTPVTADFKAAHFDARRSIYAYCCFGNVAEYGDSMIHSPEKERVERMIAKGEEGIIYKDVDLFQLRSERKKWEIIQKQQRSFIQSTR